MLPDKLEPSVNPRLQHIRTREDFIKDVEEGLKKAPMAVRLTPHICSIVNWRSPLDDPTRLQFIPLASGCLKDHKALTLDSLNEKDDSPVRGLVHRYPDKALFLGMTLLVVQDNS